MSLKSHFSHDVFHARTEKRKMTQQQVADALWISAREKQVQVTVNFNQPVESPVETRRAIQSVMNEIARQIG